MIQSPVKASKQLLKKTQIPSTSVVWIQNSQIHTQLLNECTTQQQISLKKEHQIYLANKLKVKQQLLRYKVEEFGDSSSDSDQQIQLQKHKTKDSSFEPILNKLQSQSIKTNSISQSDKSANNKKMTHVIVGSGKGVEMVDYLDVYISSKKGVDIWIQQNLKFKEKLVKVNQIQCSYYEISKVKIYLTNVANTSQQCYRVKINWGNNDEQVMFASFKNKQYKDLPCALYILAKIVTEKLQIMNKNKVVQGNIKQFPEKLMKNSIIYGKILKKSRMINKWTEVFASINKDGLLYSKKYNDKQKVLVKRGEIKQLWSRFQLQQGYLIIKLCENNSKIELGIPILNLATRDGWLFHIYNLVNQKI